MATKSDRLVYETPTEIVLEIDGLTANGDGTFTLKGVKPIDLDYEDMRTLTERLVSQGIAPRLADRLVEEAHNSIQTGLLADAIAQRTRRIG